MKENTFIFGKMKQQKIFYWKQSQIDSNDNTHHNSVVEKYFITRHYNLHKMPIYSNQQPINLSIDINQELMSSPLMWKQKYIYFMNNGLFFIKVVNVLIKTDMALILMNEF